MLDRNYRDIFAGLGLSAFGAATAVYALVNYSTGTVTRMGPGMAPTVLGTVLAVFGLLIAAPALFQKGDRVIVQFRAMIVLSASIVIFALMIEQFGLVPSVFSTTMIATLAEAKVGALRGMVLAGAMALLTWSLFILGLGLSIPAFDWPF